MNDIEVQRIKAGGLYKREFEELEKGGLFDKDNGFYFGKIANDVIELLTVLSKQGHSGRSYELVVDTLWSLAHDIPLTPLTGEDDEWVYLATKETDAGEMEIYLNRRCHFIEMHRYPAANRKVYVDTYVNTRYRMYSTDGGKTYRAIDPNSSETITMPYEVPLFPEMCILKDEPFKVHGGM